jgi:phosphoesterase RecJ-like protein
MDLLDDGLFLGVLDCGDMERICDEALRKAGPMIEIDHHDSNPHYALVNLVDPQASSTAELVWRVGESLKVQWNVKIGDPLWVGLVTDTNGFGYDKAGVNSHLMAVDLIKAGVKPHEWRAELWGRVTRSLLRMRGRVIEDMTELWNGSVVIGWTSRESLNELGLSPAQVVDVVDDLRDIEGVKIAIAGKPLEDGGWKMSVRTDSDELDVSALARTFNGGGHRAASGWLWSGSSDELTQRIITECRGLYGFEESALPEAVTSREEINE